MKKIFKFKSIRSKILFGFSVSLVFVLILAGINFYSVNKMNNGTKEMIQLDLELLIADEKIVFGISQQISAVRGYLYSGKETFIEDFEKYGEDIRKNQEYIIELRDTEGNRALLDNMTELNSIVVNDVFNEMKRGNVDKANQTITEVAGPMSTEILTEYMRLAAEKEEFIKEQGKENINSGASVLYTGLIVSILVIILGIIIAWVTSVSITKPIQRVMERMKLISSGDLSLDNLPSNSKDETGQLVDATNEMNQQMKDLLNQISEVSETVSAQSEELTQSATEVKTGSEQIASTMQELAAGSDTQANSTSDLSAGMNTFAEKVQVANEYGERIETSSKTVLNMTNNGSELMMKSIQQMEKIDSIVQDSVIKVQGLDKQTQEISNLVTVIKDVADQTNLLALNAAIEAARAGEHGKGFAVVADEVRKLAEQVSDSVTDITDIVGNIQEESGLVTASLQGGYKEVEQGKAQIESTGETFGGISEAITEMVNSITTISEGLADITASTQEMNGSIEEIAAVSEESAAGIEQTSASVQQTTSIMEEVAGSSEQLASLAEQLNMLVRKFKL
ncbi:methyl-accepting chemotaxis protein [Paucisalibacillus globulus]|uniref:methyl-accepting chemotaxis protein n=1 Tax=Paucisalibacillus globulus TaxID=351095 RepID=UPI000BB8F876|nr:methyl-accepting chemotaxis protein [Paucisalibacillus globulus]